MESGEDPKEVRRQQQTQLLGDCYLKESKRFVSAKGPNEYIAMCIDETTTSSLSRGYGYPETKLDWCAGIKLVDVGSMLTAEIHTHSLIQYVEILGDGSKSLASSG